MHRFAVNPYWSELPHITALLNGFPRDYQVSGYRTTLSLKTVVAGAARYETRGGRWLVTPDVFPVLNRGQTYSMEVDAESRTETLCPFFAPGFVEAAARSVGASDARQLDDVEGSPAPFEICERLYPMGGAPAAILGAMRAAQARGLADRLLLEDRFHDLALAVVGLRDETRREMVRLPAARATTREELYRRLHRARDLILSSYAEPLSVADVARAAAMSPFHFHRSFRRAFGRTPMQLLQDRRLEVARGLLGRGEPVTAVAAAVGYESLGSFSWRFRRAFGVSPRGIRAAAKKQP